MSVPLRRVLRGLRHVAALLGIEVLGALAGTALLLAVATLIATPSVFLVAGFLGFAGTVTGAVVLLTRTAPAAVRTRRRLDRIGALVGIGVIVFVPTAMVPMHDRPAVNTRPADLAYWDLPSGSHLAYVERPAAGRRGAGPNAAPVVFLHGGPAISDLTGDADYFGQLAATGHDVYVYAQDGAGPSSRLDDPRGYTLQRQVSDLEAVRQRIGAHRLILIGHSHGAELAAAYAARYPDRVQRMVLISPGPIPGSADSSDRGVTGRLPAGDRLRVYGLTLWPRALLAFGLLQVNPRAAHAFAGDAELDARQTRIYNVERRALHCQGRRADQRVDLNGFYAWAYPQSMAAPPEPDLRPALSGVAAPTLILKGQCDYLSWSSAVEYVRALPHAELVYLTGGGHNLYADRPRRTLALIRRFLGGRVPAPTAGVRPPASYTGPA